MEVKASRASQQAAAATPPAPQKMSRSPSKSSVAPSQMSERTRLSVAAKQQGQQQDNKDPLTALSRMTPRQMAERRCGLQDVDEEYLKNVVYAYAGRTKTAAAQRNEVRADMIPAGVPTARPPLPTGNNQNQRMPAGADQVATPEQTIPQQQQQQQQQQSAKTVPTTSSTPQNATEKIAPTQAAAAGGAQSSSTQPRQPPAPQCSAGGTSCNADPEMYTTCPNCRATLYLVRNAGDPSPYGTEHTQQPPSSPQAVPQQQQQSGSGLPVPL